jgi:undecaprenyl-diphosphatase
LPGIGEGDELGWDSTVFHWINGLAGHWQPLDRLFSGIADDYFMIITMCLVLVAMWFGTRNQHQRQQNQLAVVAAMSSLGLATGMVALANYLFVSHHFLAGTELSNIFNRPRPFVVESSVNLLFYRPSDPSFPSNMAAVVFGLAIAVWIKNRKMGWLLVGMAALACFARVYVGIHYPGDIMGGIFFALFGVGLAFFLLAVLWPLKRLIFWVLEKLYLSG